MSTTWTIHAGGRSYGPYSLVQMKAFQLQGRLATHSMVARAGEDNPRQAGDDPDLSVLFSQAATSATSPAEAPGSARFGRDQQGTGERSRFIIMAEMKSASIAALEEEIFRMGPSFRITAQAWLLLSEASLSTLRAGLIQKLGKLDSLIVIDTSHDKAAWFNFGPEAETKLRLMWQRDAAPLRNTA